MKAKFNVQKLVLVALFISLSFIGANIKILGTIAFDSMPAYLATILMGPIYGAIVGAVGHLITSMISGFPLTLPVHLIISLSMAITMIATFYSFKFFKSKNFFLSAFSGIVVGTIFNGPLASMALLPILGTMIYGLIPVLTLVSAVNALLAFIVYYFLPKSIKKQFNLK